MKKKILIISILVISIAIGVLVISKKYVKIIDKITPITELKIEEKSNNENITTIDITNLNSNIIIEHEHINKTVFDSKNHWEQCKVCGEKTNIKVHQFTSNWTIENSNNCSEENKNIFNCTCGYSYENTIGRKQHSSLRYFNHGAEYEYRSTCDTCKTDIIIHNCYKNDGSRITCQNLGQCYMCGCTYTNSNSMHYYTVVDNKYKDIKCRMCKKEFPLKVEKFEYRWENIDQMIISIDLIWNNRNIN